MHGTVRLLGLEFANLDAASAADLIARRSATASFGYVVTPNADHLVRLRRTPELRPLYEHAMLRLLDSRVVSRVARLIDLPVPYVVPGSDVTALLLKRHLAPGEPVTIVGLSPRWLPALGISAVAHLDPPRGFERNPAAMREAVDFVLAHPARFVFLAVGSPRQEMLADAIRATGRATGVGLCIGASLEFLAGARHRTPQWMRHTGLEWLHRLASDPRRMTRRYLLDDPAYPPTAAARAAAACGSRENGQIEPERPVLNVLQVGSDPAKQFLLGLGLAAQATYLRETRYARANPMACIIARGHHLERLAARTGAGRMRQWPDQRHFAVEHVAKLRQLVERPSPQKAANSCHPAVIAGDLLQRMLRRLHMVHRAELQSCEANIGVTDAPLTEQNRARTVERDR